MRGLSKTDFQRMKYQDESVLRAFDALWDDNDHRSTEWLIQMTAEQEGVEPFYVLNLLTGRALGK